MKFTRLMALVLVLMMLVSAFVACGNGNDTETNEGGESESVTETQPDKDTETEETEPLETEACLHPRLKDGETQPATCTEDGYKITICLLCDEEFKEVIPAAHTEVSLDSVDGNYIKYTCTVCGKVRVTDKAGAEVADASAIKFPIFAADFEGKADMADVVSAYIEIALGDSEFVVVANNTAEGNGYANVPSGTSDIAPNGYFSIKDINSKLATGDFSVKFAVQFIENPVDEIALLTWTIGGTAYELVTIDSACKIAALGTSETAVLVDKGWDEIEVQVDVDTGAYYVYLNGARVASANIGAAVAGKTDSAIKFFEGTSQFEANIDNISIGLIDEAK